MSKAGRTQALASLDTIYRFAGGLRSPGEVDIERPVTVVHDVSDEASQQAVIVVRDDFLVATGGTGTVAFTSRTAAQIRATAAGPLRSLGLTPANSRIWLLGYSANVTAATASDFSQASAGFIPDISGPNVVGTGSDEVLLARANNSLSAISSGGELSLIFTQGDVRLPPTWVGQHLLPVRISAFLASTQDDATGAVTVRHMPVYAIAPLGVIPEGK